MLQCNFPSHINLLGRSKFGGSHYCKHLRSSADDLQQPIDPYPNPLVFALSGEEWEGARLDGVHVCTRVGKQHATHGDGVASPPLPRTPPWRTRSSRLHTRRAAGRLRLAGAGRVESLHGCAGVTPGTSSSWWEGRGPFYRTSSRLQISCS
ncbi:hypothetical protein BT93_F1671 [Corymbia citriodora subsp. variegata]|nr:hypothetical protein BT93_F1671 [Corymbia citriodora subsp. variegata]